MDLMNIRACVTEGGLERNAQLILTSALQIRVKTMEIVFRHSMPVIFVVVKLDTLE